MHEFGFHPLIDRWFSNRFDAPTEPQVLGWPHISAGEHTLIAAPTGSGKTLAAFLAVIDRLLKDSINGQLEDGMRVIYVSPLRALSNDMHCNLSVPLDELNQLANDEFPEVPMAQVRVGLRTGDTTASQRAALVRKPPHILVTTPESLFLLLTAEKGRQALKTADTIIVDEIHALIRDKRGSHLALSIERLEALCGRRLQRIGLSATQKPIERVSRFLVGGRQTKSPDGEGAQTIERSECSIVDVGHARELDLGIEVPPSELSAVCSTEQWGEINERIIELINSHRSTLIFVNTRRLAERVTHQLTEMLGEDQVGSHHGSLSSEIRMRTEQRLKDGQLKAVVATASLELGLDVGYIDLVIQIGSPRAIATFLQRIGRSGHSLGKTPKGRLFALTRDELVECMALVRAVWSGRLDVVPIPEAPIDVLAQQIVGEVARKEWNTDELFDLFRNAWPYRNLQRNDFDETIRFLSEGLTDRSGRGRVYLHHDLVQRRVRSRPGAAIAAASNAGAIPETAEFRVLASPENTVVGTLDEDFAIESHAGQIVLLGNTSWRIEGVRGTDVIVSDAGGAPPTIPFWRGEAPGRTIELSEEVSRLREDLEREIRNLPESTVADWWADGAEERLAQDKGSEEEETPDGGGQTALIQITDRLKREAECSGFAARQVVDYIGAQIAAVGVVPTQKRVVFERFFDETGGMQMVVHAPFGGRINQAWGLAMRKRFCRSFDFELQATADDDGFILSLGPQHSFPLESMFSMLNCANAKECVEQAVLYIPMFQIRWRWNANRALLVLRRDMGKKIPPNLQRFRADDLLTSVFPLLTGCQENVVGELEVPDHILVKQTMHDCLTEALDIDGLNNVLKQVGNGEIEFIARDTREPSPFSYELLNSNPYAFLDGGEIAERRARAVSTRRSLTVESVNDLGRLDPLAIEQVVNEAQPLIRNADELHDLLLTRVVVSESELNCGTSDTVADQSDHGSLLSELVEQRRATYVTARSGVVLWTAAERLPAVLAMFPEAKPDPPIKAPSGVRNDWTDIDARIAALRGLMEVAGPLTHEEAALRTGMKLNQAFVGLEALEGEGLVLRGKFRANQEHVEWCHRRLLARIHRLTMAGLRRQIEPVTSDDFFRFLLQHHGLIRNSRRAGANGLFETISILQGMDIPAVSWERDILPSRVDGFRTQWLDELCLNGEVAWGRLYPPRRDNPVPAGLSRVVPISLFLRSDSRWLIMNLDDSFADGLSEEAVILLGFLTEHGAAFATDLELECGLPRADLNEALGELVARGHITADGFGGLRALLSDRGRAPRTMRRSRGLPRSRKSNGGPGRWSLWRRNPKSDVEPETSTEQSVQRNDDDPVEQWAWQLLRRWGVVFRDLLDREPGALRWWQLLQVYRRLEARGELRGGRFIKGVAGEQFALGETVKKLRQLREEPELLKRRTARIRRSALSPDDESSDRSSSQTTSRADSEPSEEVVVITAADPLNLIGIITEHARVAAHPHNRVVFFDGRPVAASINGEVEYLASLNSDGKRRACEALGTSKVRRDAESDCDADEAMDASEDPRVAISDAASDVDQSAKDSHETPGATAAIRREAVRPAIS